MPPADAAEPHDGSPTHAVSAALRRRLQQCYEHGTKLCQQEVCDHDYAHSILVECVLNDPGNLLYVEALLLNLQKKYKNNRRGAWLRGFGGRGAIKKAAANQDWTSVLKLGPHLLKTNPWDVVVLRAMAQGCAAHGHHEVELRYLRNALEADPKDVAVNRHCAQSLARMGHYDQAIACWTRVDEVRRGDDEAQKMISELQIEKTRQRGRPGVEASRAQHAKISGQPDAAEPEPAAQEEPPRRREVQLSPRQQLEQQIANNPADVEAYLQLVDLHLADNRFGEALHVLHKALHPSGHNPQIQERLEDVEIVKKKSQLAAAEKQATEHATDQHRQAAEQLRTELQRFEWEVYQRRCERYPTDMEVRFQLGLRLKTLDKIREAVPCFEAAVKLPNRKSAAALELGECWQRLKQYGKALDWYRRAAESCPDSQPEAKKLALYRAGVLAIGLHNLNAAESFLTQLAAIEPQYKDTRARLDKIREIRHKG